MIDKLDKDTGSIPGKRDLLRPLRKRESRTAVCRIKFKRVLPQRRPAQRIQRHKEAGDTLTREMKIKMLRNMYEMNIPGLPDELGELIDRLDELDEKEIDELYLAASFGDY